MRFFDILNRVGCLWPWIGVFLVRTNIMNYCTYSIFTFILKDFCYLYYFCESVFIIVLLSAKFTSSAFLLFHEKKKIIYKDIRMGSCMKPWCTHEKIIEKIFQFHVILVLDFWGFFLSLQARRSQNYICKCQALKISCVWEKPHLKLKLKKRMKKQINE